LPVGLVWIDLTDPTYGIHGTPGPSVIGKTQSHGCIRLTNWDAVELARMGGPGDVVRFEDQDSPIAPSAETAPVSETPRPELSRRGHAGGLRLTSSSGGRAAHPPGRRPPFSWQHAAGRRPSARRRRKPIPLRHR